MVISTVRSIAQDFTQAYYYEPSVLGYRRLGPKSKIDLYIKPFKPIVSTMRQEDDCTAALNKCAKPRNSLLWAHTRTSVFLC